MPTAGRCVALWRHSARLDGLPDDGPVNPRCRELDASTRLLLAPAALSSATEPSCAPADPFADAAEADDSGKDYVHIRVQQRNGKKSLTTIQVSCSFTTVFLIAWHIIVQV